MKKLIVLLFIISSQSGFSQSHDNVSIFHRLLVYNSDNEIMLVKIKNADVWVTPGFYQDSVQFVKKGLQDIAATYGMQISNPELRGSFLMRRENGASTEMLIRNIYHSQYLGGPIHFPENQSFEISEIKWLPLEEALSKVSFESMRIFMKQTNTSPKVIWGGAIQAIRENDQWNYEIAEEFYPLYQPKH